MSATYDYVVVGGGTAGCVIASRLSYAGFSVCLLEAGPENYSEAIMSPVGAPHLHGTAAEYNYHSTPQAALNNRKISNHGGKLLSGSSGVNYGLWTRGHSVDYDAWARFVGDDKWSYSSMLKYFKMTEQYHDSTIGDDQHGFTGNMSVSAGERQYPLKSATLTALKQSGLSYNPDGNSGNPFGVAPFTENWKNNRRQPAGLAYDLSKVHVFTKSVVKSIQISATTKSATSVLLCDGRTYQASKEVIICCGAIKTPQILMLSGIGPKDLLESLSIPVLVDLPVGMNYHDHISASLFWKLRHPERGLAIGSPAFNDPSYFSGNPIDWISTISVPKDRLDFAAGADGTSLETLYGPDPRAHVEILTAYAPLGSGGGGFKLPFDGTHIATAVILLLPTSRGKVTLASTDPEEDPIIDPNYLSTEVDRTVMREGLRTALRIMDTEEARTFVVGETSPEGALTLTTTSTSDEIDSRIAMVAGSFYQNAGTASMGSVVDTDCKVIGVEGLRVCDASILPLPIAAHYQAPTYAIAERVAASILGQDTTG
jgi:choline dehydrogenase-like flavoprotein